MTNSGRLRIAIATRSPLPTPNVGAQLLGERERAGAHLGEGEALVLVDEVDEVGVVRAHRERVEDGAGRAHEHPQRYTVEHGLLDLERAAGADERREARDRRGRRERSRRAAYREI